MTFLWFGVIFFIVGCFEFGFVPTFALAVLVGIFAVLCAIRDELRDKRG